MRNSAFTLVELAIVIVIIGLLVGGVLQGQELIKQAQNNRLISSVNQFIAATYTFKSKYGLYPGDLNKATLYWGAASSCPSGPGTGTQTCDGNGDGNISDWEAGTQHAEFFRYWQHLANANMIKGYYAGYTTSGTLHIADFNAPAGPHSGGLFGILNTTSATGNLLSTGGFPGLVGHFYVYGQKHTSGHPWGAVMTPADAMSIDTKADDGKPGSGKWTTLVQGSAFLPNCVVGNTANTATYNTASSNNECSFVIFPGY